MSDTAHAEFLKIDHEVRVSNEIERFRQQFSERDRLRLLENSERSDQSECKNRGKLFILVFGLSFTITLFFVLFFVIRS